jgi:hypothetical protein
MLTTINKTNNTLTKPLYHANERPAMGYKKDCPVKDSLGGGIDLLRGMD